MILGDRVVFRRSSGCRCGVLLFQLVSVLSLCATAVQGHGWLTTTTTTNDPRVLRSSKSQEDAAMYADLRRNGFSEVGHTAEAAALRNYHLRKKKRKMFSKKQASLTDVLFPGVAPEQYRVGEELFIITELIQSKKTHVPFEFYDLPGCPTPVLQNFKRMRKRHSRKNLGARLQGMDLKPSPYTLSVLQDVSCTVLCEAELQPHQVRWLRKLVERQYRVHMTLDQLPLLMRSPEQNYAVRGYPVGFKAPPSYTGLDHDEFYLYNHIKFTVTVYPIVQDKEGGGGGAIVGYHITGFDAAPVSIEHARDGSTCQGTSTNEGGADGADDDANAVKVENNPDTYLTLRGGQAGMALPVTYSYEVEWVQSDLLWADRWDVYLIGSPDDDIHFFAIGNSLMIVMFLTGAIATIMIRTLRKDIAVYNEIAVLEDGSEETGWKLVHGDVFRPPTNHPMLLAVTVGTGAQIGTAVFITMVAAIAKLVNPVRKGQTLTAIVVLFVLSGSVAGYVSARIAKFCDCKNWKFCTILTASALPGFLVGTFTVLNVFLSFAGAATAVSSWMLLYIFALWVGVSAPLVFAGSILGYRAEKITIPVKTNHIAKFVPEQRWYNTPPMSFLLGGILPFGSVSIELFFIMSALWLHQIYYVMGFLLAVLVILAATCAQVSVVMDYLQLCAEDHRWWWKSFGNCASAGVYLFAYALWFLVNRLDLVGFLPVVIYLTYMFMISLCFGLFCGSVGFLCAFYFNRNIYGALKVD